MKVEQHHLREALEHERDVIGRVAEWGEQHQRLRPLASATAATDVAAFYAQGQIPPASLEEIRRRLRSERAEADLYMDDPRGADTRGKGYAERYFDKTIRTDEAVAQAFGSSAPEQRPSGGKMPYTFDVGDRVRVLPGARASWSKTPSEVFRGGEIGYVRRAGPGENAVVRGFDGTDYVQFDYLEHALQASDPSEVGDLPRGSDPVTYADLEAVLGAALDDRRWNRALRALYGALYARRNGLEVRP